MRRLLICSVLPFALIACSSDEATLPQGNEGGSAGSGGTAGTSGSGGTAGSGASGGSAGSGASGGAAGSGASGGSAGTAGAGGTGQQCDPTSAPGEDACVIDDEYAIFVSPNGDDSAGDGSMASPFASIAKGITEAIAAGKRLYACADGGSYDEQVALDANNAGVSAWGSFKCSDWTYDNSLKATIAPSAEGFALSASGVNATTRLEGFEFQAQSATAAGGSSIAAFVKDSSALTLVNVKLVAGDGMKGADGQTPVSTFPAQIDLMGAPGQGAPGLGGGNSLTFAACPNGGSTKGGNGGAGDPTNPAAGADGLPASLGGTGGDNSRVQPANTLVACNSGGGGGQGQPAPAAAPGNGAITTGSLVSDVWTPEDGSNGAPGMPGGGGGGGRGGTLGGGGGGGAGGCGGAGGAPGQGGGASIALLAIDAPINLVNVEFVSASAGNGGAGSAGENGMAVGGGGGSEPADGCPGGDGGAGGKGGAGGGGAGGIAVGLVFTGNQPTLSGESFSAGTAGAAGPGGDSSNAGVAGVAQDTLDLN